MSDREQVQELMDQHATNELYRICYKEAAKSKSKGDPNSILQCHARISEAFKILTPFVFNVDLNQKMNE